MTRLRIDLAYDGALFVGWAVQPGLRTVQGVLQDALARLAGVPVAVTVAGRTDSGVHATGQVVSTDLPIVPDVRQVNGVLPPDARVTSVRPAPADFDARFSALWRRYEYLITDAVPDPRRRGVVHAHRRPLDVPAMAAAARVLLGEHDFAAFCRRRPDATTVRTLLQCDADRVGAEIVCTVRADAFCHSMVRSLVGALLAVGEGRRPASWLEELLSAGERSGEITVAPAHGLTLVEVAYPPDDELAARNAVTRRRRG